jgi:TPR repeat protein
VDLPLAVADLRKGCDGGDGDGCGHLGWAYEEGRGLEKSDATAAQLYGKAKEAGNTTASVELGALAYRGAGGAPDSRKAEALFQEACKDTGNFEHWSGCAAVAFLHPSAATGPEKTRALLRTLLSCVNGDAAACGHIAEIFEKGTGVAADPLVALSARNLACYLNPEVCAPTPPAAPPVLGGSAR